MTFNDIAEFIKSFEDLKVRMFIACILKARVSLHQARILEWVAVPTSRGSSRPRNQTGVYLYCRWILYQLSYQGSC